MYRDPHPVGQRVGRVTKREVFRSIVVPLDGSAFSQQALPAAVGLARRAGAAMHLVYVQDPIAAPVDVPGGPVLDQQLVALSETDMERDLRGLAGRVSSRGGLRVSTAIRHGRASEAIAAYAREVGADLIVLTTHGRSGLSRLWLGSVADELVRIADVPVLAVRPARRRTGLGREQRFRHALVPLDGSELAELALDPVAVAARLAKGRVTLLRVVRPHRALARPAPVSRLDRADLARQREKAEHYLRGVAERLQQEGVRVATLVVAGGDPARAILRSAATHGADLIAMATHARGGLGRFVLGSVCDKVLRGATRTAVLLTRSPVAATGATPHPRS